MDPEMEGMDPVIEGMDPCMDPVVEGMDPVDSSIFPILCSFFMMRTFLSNSFNFFLMKYHSTNTPTKSEAKTRARIMNVSQPTFSRESALYAQIMLRISTAPKKVKITRKGMTFIPNHGVIATKIIKIHNVITITTPTKNSPFMILFI